MEDTTVQTPAPAEPSPTPSTPVASDSTPEATPSTPSFAESLRAASGQADPPAPEPDFATRLATEKAEWQKQYEWVGDLNQEQLQTLRQHADWVASANADPMAAVEQLIALSLAHPEHRQKALSFAGRLLAGHTGTASQSAAPAHAPAKREIKPIPALSTDGQTTLNLYTAEDVQQIVNDLRAELTGQLQPIQQAHQTAAEREAAAERSRQEVAFANDIYAKMSQKPGFLEHRAEIAAAFEKMKGNHDPYQARENLRDAYESVVYGKLQSSASAAAASDNARRAAASTGRVVSPQPTQASPTAALSFSERLAEAMARSKGA